MSGRSFKQGHCTTTAIHVKLNLGAKERKVKIRSLKTEGCGTPRVTAPPARAAQNRDSFPLFRAALPARRAEFPFSTHGITPLRREWPELRWFVKGVYAQSMTSA
jgi:hypothetical protein